jgi:lysophospholipase L1-like esterase
LSEILYLCYTFGMTIGVWGDSITHGSGDSEALGWVGRIRKALSTHDYNHIYNFGICGETSENVLARFAIEAKAIKPDHIVIAVGINDSKFPEGLDTHKVSLDNYRKNLSELLLAAKQYTDSIALVSATKVNDEWRSARGSRFINKEIAKFNEVLAILAKVHGLKYIDVFESVDPATDLADGLHPNAQGYQKMFEVIKSNLKWL